MVILYAMLYNRLFSFHSWSVLNIHDTINLCIRVYTLCHCLQYTSRRRTRVLLLTQHKFSEWDLCVVLHFLSKCECTSVSSEEPYKCFKLANLYMDRNSIIFISHFSLYKMYILKLLNNLLYATPSDCYQNKFSNSFETKICLGFPYIIRNSHYV